MIVLSSIGGVVCLLIGVLTAVLYVVTWMGCVRIDMVMA